MRRADNPAVIAAVIAVKNSRHRLTRPAGEPKRLVIFAHGGLNSEDAAITRARALGRHFLANGCYPLFLVWKTGLQESISGIVSDAFRKQPTLAGGAGEWISERTDLLVEK